jgi:tetratricopeptide (TPR) repeat protein
MPFRRTARLAAAAALLLLPACAPRGVAPADGPEPEAVPAAAEEESAVERMLRARRFFDEAVLLGRQGRWREAESRYRTAAELDPGNPTYPLALADALLAQARDSEAADALWAGIRAEEALPAPNHRVLAVDYERLIQILVRVGRQDEARNARMRQVRHRELRDAQVQR